MRLGAPATHALLLAAILLCGCGPAAPPPSVVAEVGGVRVESPVPIQSVVVSDPEGLQLARRDPGPEVRELVVPHPAPQGVSLTVSVRRADGGHQLTVEAAAPHGLLTVRLDAPVGQGARPVIAGEEFEVHALGEGGMAAVLVRAEEPGEAAVELGGAEATLRLRGRGEAQMVLLPLPAEAAAVLKVRHAGRQIEAPVVLYRTSLVEARAALQVDSVRLPTDARGRSEPARAAGRVTLPAGWWRSLLHRSGLGYRPRDELLPWASAAVDLSNSADAPLNVALQLRVLDAAGRPAPAFRPRMRATTGDTGVVSGLLRVPAGGTATAVLPLFVDDRALPEGASEFVREITVTPLGSAEALWRDREPLRVQRGRSWVSGLFGVHLLAALLGWILVLRGLPRWLGAARTSELTTVAVFATLTFVVAAAAAVIASAAGAVLGPFQTFLTNLLDDALQYALLATLVCLLPRPGVVALAVLVAFLMRGIALGGFDPASVALLPGRIFWLEAFLWLAGVTRSDQWLSEGRARRWLRLGAGFATASAFSAAGALVTQMVLYRLHYAGWYLVAVVAGPGFLYVWIACGLATGFAASLREVEP